MPLPPRTPQQQEFLRDVTRRSTQSHRTGLASVLDPSLGSTPREYEAFLIDRIRRGDKAIIDAIRNDKVRRDLQYRLIQRFSNDVPSVDVDRGVGFISRNTGEFTGEYAPQRASAGNPDDLPQRWRYLKVLEKCRAEAEHKYGRNEGEWRSTIRPPEQLVSKISTAQGGMVLSGTPSMGNVPVKRRDEYQRTQSPVDSEKAGVGVSSRRAEPYRPFHEPGRGTDRARRANDEERQRSNRPWDKPHAPGGGQGSGRVRGGPNLEYVKQKENDFHEKLNRRYQDPSWGKLQQKIGAEKGFKCAACGSTHGIELHHHNYDRLGNETSDDVDFLCHYHHLGDEGIHKYLEDHGLALTEHDRKGNVLGEHSKRIVRRGVDPYTGKYKKGADYLDARVPYGSYRGRQLGDLSGYELQKIENNYEWFKQRAVEGGRGSQFAKFFAAINAYMITPEWHRLTEPHGDIYRGGSPRDDDHRFDPFHPDALRVLPASFAGGPQWGGKGEAGVVYSGIGRAGIDPYGQQIKMNYKDQQTGKLMNAVEHYAGPVYLTPYRYRNMGEHRDMYPSRANEQRFVKEYDPERRISEQRKAFWNVNPLGGVPHLYTDKYGREHGTIKGGFRGIQDLTQEQRETLTAITRDMRDKGHSEEEIKQYKREWGKANATPIFGGAKSVLMAEVDRMRKAGIHREYIREYKRAYVESYAQLGGMEVDRMEREQAMHEASLRGLQILPEGPDREEENPFMGPLPDVDYSDKPASKEDFPGEYSDLNTYESANTGFAHGNEKDMSAKALWGVHEEERPYNMSQKDMMEATTEIWNTQNQEELDEVWERLSERHWKDDVGLTSIMDAINERKSGFNAGGAP